MFGLVLGSESGSLGTLVKDLPRGRGGVGDDDWGVGLLGPIMT